MAETVTRDVVMRLKLAAFPGNSAIAKAVAAQAAKAQSGDLGLAGAAEKKAASEKAASANIAMEQKSHDRIVANRIKMEARAQAEQLRQVLSGIKYTNKQAEIAEAEKTKIALNRQKMLGRIAAMERADADKAEAERTKIALNRQKMLGRIAAMERADADKAEQTQRIAASRAAALNQRAFMAQQATAQAFARVGHGFLAAGKGLAMAGVFTENEKDLEKLVIGLAKVEIGFQALKGGLDIFTGIRQGLNMWRRASDATTAANNLLALSNLRVGQTGAIAAASGTGIGGGGRVGRAAGRGLAGAGIGAAVGQTGFGTGSTIADSLIGTATALAIPTAMRGISVGAGKLGALLTTAGSTFLGLATAGGVALNVGVSRVAKYFGLIDKASDEVAASLLGFADKAGGEVSSGIVDAMFQGFWKSGRAAEKLASVTEREIAQRTKLIAQAERTGAFVLAQRQIETETREGFIRATVGNEAGTTTQQRTEKQESQLALRARRDAERFEKRYQDALEASKKGGAVEKQLELNAIIEYEGALGRVAESELKRLDALRQQVDVSRQAVEQTKAQARASADALKSEEQKHRSQLASFGALSGGQQEYIRQIAKRMDAGQKASDSELDYLNKLGIALEVGEERRAEKGLAAGGAGIFAATGDIAQLSIARKRAAEDATKIAEEERRAVEAQRELEKRAPFAGEAQRRLGQIRLERGALTEETAEGGLSRNQQQVALVRNRQNPVIALADDTADVLAEETDKTVKAFEGLIVELKANNDALRTEFDRWRAEFAIAGRS